MRTRLSLTSFLLCTLAMVAGQALPAATLQQLDSLASQLLTLNRYDLRGQIVAHRALSSGYAAIQWMGNVGTIYVDPDRLANESLNTWAFVLGHELAHNILNHGGSGPSQEFEADRHGARMAVNAGYDVRDYVRRMYRDPNTCSRSHGCFHQRARRLEQAFGVHTGEWDSNHSGHAVPTVHFPPSRRAPSTLKRRVPCRHRVACTHRVACQHRGPCVHRTACGHRMACQHVFMTPYGPRAQHPFDTYHPYDTLHAYDHAHPYDTQHPYDLQHEYDLVP